MEEEQGLSTAAQLGAAGTGKVGQKTEVKSTSDLESRLAMLKQ